MTNGYAHIVFEVPSTIDKINHALSIWIKACAEYPDATIDFYTSRYDDDPRSIWDIPEAWPLFAHIAKTFDRPPYLERLMPETSMLLTLCTAAMAGKAIVKGQEKGNVTAWHIVDKQ